MSDASCVRGIQRVGNLNAEFQNAIDQQRFAVEDVLKGLALHQLHNDEGLAVVVRNFVNGADVRMIQSGGGAGFAQEAVERWLIFGGVRREKFECDAAIEDGVAGGIHDAHASAAEAFHDAIVRDGLTDHRYEGPHHSVICGILCLTIQQVNAA